MARYTAGKAGWRPRQGMELARDLAGQVGGELDWDEDAGEDWARVLPAGRPVVLVCLTGPLAIVTSEVADTVRLGLDVIMVIDVPAADAAVLRCDLTVLGCAFGNQARDNPALDADAFSALDLWFCTV